MGLLVLLLLYSATATATTAKDISHYSNNIKHHNNITAIVNGEK